MNRSFRIRKSENFPVAVIPNRWIWDLVEYLAFLRVQATYTYRAQQFIVHFPHLEPDQVQELLDGWAEKWPATELPAADQSSNMLLATLSGWH